MFRIYSAAPSAFQRIERRGLNRGELAPTASGTPVHIVCTSGHTGARLTLDARAA